MFNRKIKIYVMLFERANSIFAHCSVLHCQELDLSEQYARWASIAYHILNSSVDSLDVTCQLFVDFIYISNSESYILYNNMRFLSTYNVTMFTRKPRFIKLLTEYLKE